MVLLIIELFIGDNICGHVNKLPMVAVRLLVGFIR